jgi:hypothetical protein
MIHARRRFQVLVLATAFMVPAAGCATDPENVTPAPAPASASTTRNGVVVTVAASDETVTGGATIRLRVTVLNVGLGPVTWQSGGCGLLEWFGIDGPGLEQPPAGAVWPGVANLVKWSATSGGGGVAYAWIRQPDLDPDVVMGCPANLAYDDIGPGETITTEADWPATTSEGVPLPSGRVLITYAFPFVGRFDADTIGPDQNVNPIPVALPIAVAGDAPDVIASTEAIDAALGDARVADWIVQRVPKERLTGATIRFEDGRWRFTIGVEPGGSTVVLIDPASGHVDEVQLAD